MYLDLAGSLELSSFFRLKCEVCGEGLVGEKEARDHASDTSHTRFGEYDG